MRDSKEINGWKWCIVYFLILINDRTKKRFVNCNHYSSNHTSSDEARVVFENSIPRDFPLLTRLQVLRKPKWGVYDVICLLIRQPYLHCKFHKLTYTISISVHQIYCIDF